MSHGPKQILRLLQLSAQRNSEARRSWTKILGVEFRCIKRHRLFPITYSSKTSHSGSLSDRFSTIPPTVELGSGADPRPDSPGNISSPSLLLPRSQRPPRLYPQLDMPWIATLDPRTNRVLWAHPPRPSKNKIWRPHSFLADMPAGPDLCSRDAGSILMTEITQL